MYYFPQYLAGKVAKKLEIVFIKMQFLNYITHCAAVYYDGMVCKRDFLIHMTSKCSVADKTLGSTKSLLKYFTTLYLLKYKLEELSFTFSVFVL